jgi:hypothetical protein
VCPNPLQVDGRGNDLDIIEGELGALSDDLTVQGDEGAAVVVKAVAVAALLVGIKVETAGLCRGKVGSNEASEIDASPSREAESAYLKRRFLDQVDASLKLAEFVVRTARVGEDLDTVKRHLDVRPARKSVGSVRFGGNV